jgi:hypothetical protein
VAALRSPRLLFGETRRKPRVEPRQSTAAAALSVCPPLYSCSASSSPGPVARNHGMI